MDFQPSLEQIVTTLLDPKGSYHFVSNYGKKPQILPHLIQILILPNYKNQNSLRIQAAILIRNGIDSWYSKLSPNQIDNQLKIELGQTLVENILARGESDSVVRKQVILCVGKIGKFNLVSNLSNLINDNLIIRTRNLLNSPDWSADLNNYCVLNGCLGGFYQIIQNLISNRSSRGQLLLREVVSTHFSHIHDVYSISFSMWTALSPQQATWDLATMINSQRIIELSRICLKILSQMSTYAWKEPHTQELPTNFLKQSITQWAQLLKIRQAIVTSVPNNPILANNHSSLERAESFFSLLHKHLFKFGKFLIQIFNHDPYYLEMTDVSNSLKQTVWQMVDQGSHLIGQENLVDSRTITLAIYPQKIIIQSLRIMSLWMSNQHMSSRLNTAQSIELTMSILQRLLLLQPHSLRFWNEDPESYDNEEANSLENGSFDVRACAASVLTSLLTCYPLEISNVILQMFSNLYSQDPNALPILLQQESAYFGIGLAAHHLAHPTSGFDLKEWITNKCIPVSCQVERSGAILRRRVAWVLGQFAKQDLTLELQSHVYTALSCLIDNPNNDLAVKIATCRALKATSNWEPAVLEEANVILPHIETFIKQISHLLSSVENLESQKILTDALRLVIEKARSNILPYALQLSTMMASLWQQVGESPSKSNIGNHLHNAILVAMSSLVEAIGPSSQEFHGTIALFVQHSVNPNNPSSIYLQEDGLTLWLTMMRQTEMITPYLAEMLVTLATLIPDATDSLAVLLKILESYLLLDYQLVFRSAGSLLSNNFSQLLNISMELAPTTAILHSIECIVKCAEPSLWQGWFEESDCFFILTQRSISTQGSVLIVVKHLLTMCRLIVHSASSFFNLVGSLSRQGVSPADVLSSFCKACFDKIDNVSTAQERKLIAAALACLVGNPNPIVLGNLAEFVSIWSSVLAEGDEILNEKTNIYRYSHESEDNNDYEFIEAPAEAKRIQQLLTRDPVKTKTLDRIISENIATGGQPVMTCLSSLDSFSLNELQQRLTGNLKG